jgi:hypothetical protein
LSGIILDLFQHYPACANCRRLWRKWSHSLSNKIRINEVPAIGILGKELAREGRFADSIWTSNDI